MSDQSHVHTETDGAAIKSWTRGVKVEDEAWDQLRNAASLPFIHKHIAVMPDVHWGLGATIGSVIPTRRAIVPAAVGVDIGCGMMAVPTPLTSRDLPDNLLGVRSAIERAVPHGRTDNGGANDRGAWGDVPEFVVKRFHGDCDEQPFDADDCSLAGGLEKLTLEYPKLRRPAERAIKQFGTLGTGNHFIEVCLDTEDRVWVMLHSGSRGIGNAIARQFIALAKSEMERWYVKLPDQDLAYLPEGSKHFQGYVAAVFWAQAFARTNRQIMMKHTLEAIGRALNWPGDPLSEWAAGSEAVNCHHNYVAREHHFGKNVWVTRKGAVRARRGDMGIIPGSMGARSYIVRGKGNPDSFHSCSHGAGRAMSRGAAKRKFSIADHESATQGVECRKDAGVLDETPMAYKPIDDVMNAQADLVEIVTALKQVVCVKG